MVPKMKDGLFHYKKFSRFSFLKSVIYVTGGISGGHLPEYRGESMNVVTEKRLAELQADFDHMRSTWVDPVKHHTLNEQLKQAELARTGFEVSVIHSRNKTI